MTTISADSLDHPYSAFDVSLYQPLESNTISNEALAIAFARLTNETLPDGLAEIGATQPQLGERESQYKTTALLDRYRSSRVYLNAIQSLQKFLVAPETSDAQRHSVVKGVNPFNMNVPRDKVDNMFSDQSENSLSIDQKTRAINQFHLITSVWWALYNFCEFEFNARNVSSMRAAIKKDDWKVKSTEFIEKVRAAALGTTEQLFPVFEDFGLLHRYRQHFLYHELKAGPLESVRALAPGESLEVVLTETYTSTYEQTIEDEIEVTKTMSEDKKSMLELSDRVASTINNSATTTVSADGGYNAVLWSASGSASTTVANSSTTANEQITKRLQETTKKQSEQIRKKTRVTTKVVETRSTDTSTRHVIKNVNDHSVNYGLRRLCYDVDCKVQDLAPLLVWQSFVSKPGDLLTQPELLDMRWSKEVRVPLPHTFEEPVGTTSIHGNTRTLQHDLTPALLALFNSKCPEPDEEEWKDFHEQLVSEVSIFDVRILEGIANTRQVFDNTQAYSNFASPISAPNGIVTLNLNEDPKQWLSFTFIYSVTFHLKVIKKDTTATEPLTEGQMELKRVLAILSFQDGRRNRDSLLFEERKVLLAKVIAQMIPKVNSINDEILQQLYQEINEYFDLKKFFYDVDLAEWAQVKDLKSGEARTRTPYLLISGQKAPAHMGASLGWKHQIDGDVERDMLINADWAWVGVPVKPGKERKATQFLMRYSTIKLDKRMDNLVDELERLRKAEEIVARQHFNERHVAIGETDKPTEELRPWLAEKLTPDEFKNKYEGKLKWKEVYPVISEQHTVTTVDGFIFDTITLADKWRDNGKAGGAGQDDKSGGIFSGIARWLFG